MQCITTVHLTSVAESLIAHTLKRLRHSLWRHPVHLRLHLHHLLFLRGKRRVTLAHPLCNTSLTLKYSALYRQQMEVFLWRNVLIIFLIWHCWDWIFCGSMQINSEEGFDVRMVCQIDLFVKQSEWSDPEMKRTCPQID